MRTTVGKIKRLIREAVDQDGFAALISDINARVSSMYKGAKIPEDALRRALTADVMTVGRLPTMIECEVMLSGNDDDEDAKMTYLQDNFPETLSELESAWQLGSR